MDTLTSFYYQAQDFVTENPWIVLVVLIALFWFVVRPRLCKGGLFEGFSGGQSIMGKEGYMAQDEYATAR